MPWTGRRRRRRTPSPPPPPPPPLALERKTFPPSWSEMAQMPKMAKELTEVIKLLYQMPYLQFQKEKTTLKRVIKYSGEKKSRRQSSSLPTGPQTEKPEGPTKTLKTDILIIMSWNKWIVGLNHYHLTIIAPAIFKWANMNPAFRAVVTSNP